MDPLKVFQIRALFVRGHVDVNLSGFVRHATIRENAESLILLIPSNPGQDNLLDLFNIPLLAWQLAPTTMDASP